MSKSRKRGGEKAHRKRVQARNAIMKGKQRKFQKMFENEMMTQLENYKNALSGETNQEENKTNDGFIQSSENV